MEHPHQGGRSMELERLMVKIASVFMAANHRRRSHFERDSDRLQQQ